MDPLVQLAIMGFGVFVASLLARKTRLTIVLYFLASGALAPFITAYSVADYTTRPKCRENRGCSITRRWVRRGR